MSSQPHAWAFLSHQWASRARALRGWNVVPIRREARPPKARSIGERLVSAASRFFLGETEPEEFVSYECEQCGLVAHARLSDRGGLLPPDHLPDRLGRACGERVVQEIIES